MAALLAPSFAAGQNHPLPANVTEPAAICTGCPGMNSEGQPNDGKPTWAFDVPLAYHVGRYVDSSATQTYGHDALRTVRANAVRIAAGRDRLYVALGDAVGVYPLEAFFSHLVRMPPEPVSSIKGTRMIRNPVEKATIPVAYFDIEDSNSGWLTDGGIADVGSVLYDFDLDDRGYLYAASSPYGWGINYDDGRVNQSHLPFVYRSHTGTDRIFTLQTGGAYYAVTSQVSDGSARIYETTVPATPSHVRTDVRGFVAWDRNDAAGIVATIARDGVLRIHTFAAYVAGDAAIAEHAPSTGRALTDLSFDEDGRLWVAEKSKVFGSSNVLWRLSPSGPGFVKQTFDVYPAAFSPTVIAAAGGWIAVGGRGLDAEGTSGSEVHLLRIEDGVPSPVDSAGFFRRYYFSAPSGYAEPLYSDLSDLRLVVQAGATYLMNSAGGLGDVFELGSALMTQARVTEITPRSGPPSGGTTVGLAGANLRGNVTVSFGGIAATSVQLITSNWMTVVTPPHPAGAVDVTVNVNGSDIVAPAQFTYLLKAPATFAATATTPTSVNLTVQQVEGASGYEYFRRNPDGSWLSLGVGGATFLDSGRTANTAHVYRARAVDGGGATSDYSPMDVATTSAFSSFASGTPIRASHANELREAINVLRASAGLPAAVFTDTIAPGMTIRAIHVSEMREALSEGRAALGVPAVNLGSDAVAGGTLFSDHFVLIRDGFH